MSTARIIPQEPKLAPEHVQAIAQALGSDWQSTMDPNQLSEYVRQERATLTYVGSDPLLQGASLTGWSCRGGPGQIEWSANLHATMDGERQYLKDCMSYNTREAFVSAVNISAAKSPQRIAKELQTRLLTAYLPAYRHALTYLQEQRAQHAADEALAAELAGLVGNKVRRQTWNGSKAPWVDLPIVSGFRVEHGRVHIERGFSLSPQQARELCALVGTWKGQA